MKSLNPIRVVALALLGLLATDVSSEEAKLGIPISALPAVISSPGVYVLQQDFEVNLQSGAALTIAADNVVINFNGHTISNMPAGAATEAYGVYSLDRANLTVRNGRVKGFNVGVFLNGSDNLSYGHLVEKVLVDRSTSCGIYLFGAQSIVRRCEVTKTGGSSLATNRFNAGIAVTGTGTRILENSVSEVGFPAAGTFPSVGIYLRSVDGFVVSNRVSQVHTGLYLASRTAKFRDNLMGAGITVASNGGVDAGSTAGLPGGPRRPPPPPATNNPAPSWAPPANYEAWILDQFSASERANQATSGKAADPDIDGRSNFQEFDSGTSPQGWRIPAAGLRLWLRGDLGVHLGSAFGGPDLDEGEPPSVNAIEEWVVDQWEDQSTNQISLSAAGSQRPSLEFNSAGYPFVRFNGSAHILQTAGAVDIFQGNPEWTIFFVTHPGTSQEAYADIMDQDHDSVSFVVQQNGTNTNQFGIGVNLIPLQSDRMQMVSSVKTTERQVDYINGIQHADLAAGPFSPQVRRFGVGGWMKGGRFFNGDIAEIIIYNRALTEPERGEVEGWLHSRYNLDLDGMPYEWEIEHRLDVSRNDALLDPDGDGLGNLTEYQLGTDPRSSDSDGDGMPDGWEVSNGVNPRMHDSWGDWDEDTFSNGDEYRLGTNPFAFDYDSDYDRRPDSVDAAPYDYYNGLLPRITPISGDGQSALGGQVLAQPLVVQVTDAFGLLLPSAPLQLSSSVPGTAFAVAPDESFFSTATFFADAQGKATIYVRLPAAVSPVSIQVTAASGLATQTVNFSATAVAPPAIAAGEYHTVALGSSGMVWAWGLNSSGQLGDGTKLQRSLPSPVKGLRNVTAIAAGAYHTIALKHDGTVVAWGANSFGQLGVGDRVDRSAPAPVYGLTDIVAIASGSYHNLALRSNGALYAWGFNGNGQLGIGTDIDQNVPLQVAGMFSGSGVVSIAAGAYHSLAVKADGTQLGWGANYYGALGTTAGARYVSPVVIPGGGLKKPAAGAYHTMAIKHAGGADARGWNADGQLGDSTTITRASSQPVIGLEETRSLAASHSLNGHCLALTPTGAVYTWGANYAGQLGRNATTDQATARPVSDLPNIEAVAAGGFHSAAVATSGNIYTWGDNDLGQLGDGTTTGQPFPVKKPALNLLPTAEDSDQDGLEDRWELQHFGGLGEAGDGDPDGDRLVNLLESQTGRNPRRVDYAGSGVPPAESRLVNLSSRADVGTGENILIAGFMIRGDAPQRIALRALGPSLTAHGVSGALGDPQIHLMDSNGQEIAYNNNWKDNPAQRDALIAAGLGGGHDLDAALMWELPPGDYTALVSGWNGGTGVTLLELYDITAGGAFFANLSARARLSTGDKVIIAGFIITGEGLLRAAVRAIGPSLAMHGISNPLMDPELTLHNRAGNPIAYNNNWKEAPNWSDVRDAGIAPTDDRESTILRHLEPYDGEGGQHGVYTAVVRGREGGEGVALVEVYDLGRDSDGDGLSDWEEIHTYRTKPDQRDSDGDGMPDGYEVHHGLDPNKTATERDDHDGDGVSDLAEYQAGKNPSQFDFVQGTTVGTTQGKLAVGNNGGASYSIPITVSPGTAGMQPKLSFEYSSRGGNGIMGMGWSIAGLSAITRVPPTRAQDGLIRGVDFSATDRFAMDGQRLIAVSGADGAPGTLYRTELESFTRVVSLGQSGTGPRSFKAETKSGLTYFFGESDDSRFIAEGRNDALSWAISRIEDRNGNSMSFHYLKKSDGRELLLDYITYTANAAANLLPYARVEFAYEGRPDVAFGYVAGSQTRSTHRLKTVTSKFGGQVVRQYTVNYRLSDSTKKSLVENIQEGAGGLFFNPTTFVWSHEKARESNGPEMIRSEFTGDHNYRGKTEGQPREQWMEGDFSGDGRSDFARVTTTSINENFGPARIDISVATPGQNPGDPPTFVQSPWVIGNTYNISDRWISGDFDGDGKLDMLRFYDGKGTYHYSAMQLYKNGGTNFPPPSSCAVTGNLKYKDYALVYPADINGDGRLDLLAISGESEHGISNKEEKARTQFAVFLNQGTTGGTTNFAGSLWGLTNPWPYDKNQIFQMPPERWLLGDATGDGLPDIFFIRNTDEVPQVNFYRNNNNGTFTRHDWTPDEDEFKRGLDDYDSTIWQTGDFNGDGLVDLLYLLRERQASTAEQSPVTVYLATGNPDPALAFSRQKWGTIPLLKNLTGYKIDVRVGDFNGDGRSDIGLVETISTTQSGTPGEPPEEQIPNSYTQTFFRSNGHNGFIQEGSIKRDVPNHQQLGTLQWMPADFNGDGREDLARLYTYGTSPQRISADIWTSTTGVRDQLKSVKDAMVSTTAIEYKTLADSLYTRFAPNDVVVDNAVNMMVPMPVVASVRYDNGLADGYTVSYKYSGLKAHRQRGMLGFRSIRAEDSRTPGAWAETTLRQDFPFTGMALSSATYQPDGRPLTISTTTYPQQARLLHGGKVHLVYAQKNISESWELNGNLISKTTTETHEIDDYGNTTNLSVESLDGFKKTTNSTYDPPNEASWKIGQLRRSTVTHTAPPPDRPAIARTSSFDYNDKGQVEAETIEPDSTDLNIWSQTRYQFDQFGNTKVTTTRDRQDDPDTSRSTTTHYDERGRFVRETINALLQTETRRYDERWGSVHWVKGPNGLETTTLYDDLGRERLITRADGSRTITTYHKAEDDADAPNGAVYFVRSAVDGVAPGTVFFDRLGRELRKKTFGGVAANNTSRTIFVDTEYNEKGQIEAVSRPYSPGDAVYKARTFYDLLGRAERIETPKEGGGVAVTTNVYRGLEVDTINPEQKDTPFKTTTKKDSQGHLRFVTDAKNGTVEYRYDAAGDLVKTIQGNNVTEMGYDRRGRKKWVDDPDLGYWTYEYNFVGELTSQTDAKGQTVTMAYDKLGRLKSRAELEGVSTWTYDNAPGKGVGKLSVASFAPAGSDLVPYSRTMEYDDLGRPITQTERIRNEDYKVKTGYGAFSRVETITYPSTVSVKQLYDEHGYLNEIQRADGTLYWKATSYDAEGHIKQQKLGNQVVTDRLYVAETGVLKSIQSGLNGSAGVQNLHYEFSVIGNLKRRADYRQNINETFVYDELNRVRRVDGPATRHFDYDLLGNIISKEGVGTYSYTPAVPESLLPNERAKPHAVRSVDNHSSPDARYDANGNMTSGFNRTLTWTSFNMPNLIQRGGASSRFTYDADHARITQEAVQGGVVTRTTYVGAMYEVVTQEGIKREQKHYIASPAGRIAVFTRTTDLRPNHPPGPTDDTKFLHTDHLGSIDAVTNEAGAVIERDSFDSWGSRRPTSWQAANSSIRSIISRGYTGHEQLDDLGLVHMNGRVYDPLLGRFLSADPLIQAPTETQNFNRYSYVLNNPLSLTDPSGFNFLNNFGKWLNDNLGETGAQVVIGVISIAAGVATAGAFTAAAGALWGATFVASGTLGGSIVAGAGFGFGAGFISTSLSGASLGQALQSALIGAVIGGISGGIAHGLGNLNPMGEFATLGHAGQTAGHAIVGGTLSEIQGGDFGSGALAAGLSAGVAPGINLIGGGSPDIEYVAARVSVSAAVGGTVAEISGGKFANGAVTAAFLRLYNEEGARRAYERRIEAVRARIAQFAYDAEGSRGWLQKNVSGAFPAGKNKCNKFVADIIILAGGDVELIQRAWYGSASIPLAKEWANINLNMPGWRVVTSPQPGDVAAVGINPQGGGHVAIVVGPGQTASSSVGVLPKGLIVVNDWGFRGNEGAPVVFRRYVGPGY